MSVFSSQIRYKPWLGQVTILSVIMGGLLALSLKTQDKIRTDKLGDMRPGKFAQAYSDIRDENNRMRREMAETNKRLQKYQQEAGTENAKAALLAEDLKTAQILAGLTPLTGPGVIVTLRDSPQAEKKPADISDTDWEEYRKEFYIHDRDIRDVVNELKAAGAEAIAVNDQRVISTTPVRCVGPTVMVNGVPTAGSPVRIKAIGNPDTMLSGMLMPKGVLDPFKLVDPAMVKIDKVDNITLPAFTGAVKLRFAKVATESKAEQAQKDSEAAAKTGDAALVGHDGANTTTRKGR